MSFNPREDSSDRLLVAVGGSLIQKLLIPSLRRSALRQCFQNGNVGADDGRVTVGNE
jgi:hypothetical protein